MDIFKQNCDISVPVRQGNNANYAWGRWYVFAGVVEERFPERQLWWQTKIWRKCMGIENMQSIVSA
jgi:hypothetical protein